MPAKRCKKNAQFGLAGKLAAEWRQYGKKTSIKHRQTNVGVGLLAKAVCQPLYPMTERLLSRASPLPHCFVVGFKSDED
ncbi:hypothetical protein [Pseudomonas sp. K2I15]|uniref:hypothetical protein n=1 Tax=unclassified Pseudomonas TaxID=196821 RepID=UPI001595EDD9|nr:hypothetical protein [Pseudomonas sp. K2I15]